MTWVPGCDASYDKPDFPTLYKLGYRVFLGYLSNTPGKGMTAEQILACRKAGLWFGALYETTADAAQGGYPTGAAQARAARSIGAQVGYPANKLVIFALDKDYTANDMAGPVSQFVEGLHTVAGPEGEYGGINQLRYLVSHNLGDKGRLFQTYAWSAGDWMPVSEAPIEQFHNGLKVANGTVDDCRVDTSILPLLLEPLVEENVTPAEFLAILKDPAVVAQMKLLTGQGVFGFDPGTVVDGKAVANGGILVPDYQPDSVASGGSNPTAGLGWAVSELLRNVHTSQVALASVLTALQGLPAAVAAQLPASGGATPDQIQAACAAAVAETVAKISLAVAA